LYLLDNWRTPLPPQAFCFDDVSIALQMAFQLERVEFQMKEAAN